MPESLLHQWFVELLRRFQVTFSIFDEDRCRSIEDEGNPSGPAGQEEGGQKEGGQEKEDGSGKDQGGGPGTEPNPFLEEQFVLCSTDFLVENELRGQQAWTPAGIS